jgi:hypothetical protein
LPSTTAGLLTRFFSKLRFPWLFGLVLALFASDLIVPDFVPFIDELLLGLTTVLLGSWKQRKSARADAVKLASEREAARVPAPHDQSSP